MPVAVHLLAHLAIVGQQSDPQVLQQLLDRLLLASLTPRPMDRGSMIEGPASPTGHTMIKAGVSK